jgi:hypothetical protein
MWSLLEPPHEVPNPYDKTPQPSAWVLSTLTNLGTFSKAMWKDRCTKLHNPTNTSSPKSDLDADIFNSYANPQDLLAADRQLLNRPISKVLKFKQTNERTHERTKQDGPAACATPIAAFLQSA